MAKTIIYQLIPRLYGNINNKCKCDGTIEENGCGKLSDINDLALEQIASMGISHVWYTGLIRHASTTHYPFESWPANANVVKGRAGSPYAICDYYDIDPDLSTNVDKRMEEFQSLVERTHKHHLKVIIDFVPNHVARNYYSDSQPSRPQLGDSDNVMSAFERDNNFYYLPNTQFVAPKNDRDVPYEESPAKASGNDAYTPSPSVNDWYETVKLNYGIDYHTGNQYFEPKPDTWIKMRDILMYWAAKGIDGFRVDMAEMVPIEFWRWVIGQVNMRHPNVIFIAETYNKNRYREYIEAGFNLLYDKSNFYDITRAVMQGNMSAMSITDIWHHNEGIGRNMLFFLENHDEQRVASDYFVGSGEKGKAGVLLSTLMGNGASMIYFGQEFGERGMDEEGFSGRDGRTTIFDYWSVSTIRQFVDSHKYTGAQLSKESSKLWQWYKTLLNLVQTHDAFSQGEMYDLMWINQNIFVDATKIYAFLRYDKTERFIIALNFSDQICHTLLRIPEHAWQQMGNTWNESIMPIDMLGNVKKTMRTSVRLSIERGLELDIPANDGVVLRF